MKRKKNQSKSKAIISRFLPPVVLFLLIVILRLPTMSRPFDLAYESFIAFWGREVFAGGGFYSTPWTFKPPGEALVYGLIYRLVGFENWVLGVRIFSSLMVGAATVFIYLLGKKLFGGWSGIAAALIFAVFSTNAGVFGGGLAQAEMWMPATTVLGFYLFFTSLERKSYFLRFLAGLSLGVSFSFKQSALYDFTPLFIYAAGSGILDLKNKKINLKSLSLSQLLLILGFILPMSAFVLYILGVGKISLLWDWMVVKTGIYSAIREPHPMDYIIRILQKIYPIVVLGFLGVAATILRRDRKRVLFILWLFFTPLVFVSSGKLWNYYFIQMFVPLCLLSGIFINDLLSLKRRGLSGIFLLGMTFLIINLNLNYYQFIFTRYFYLLKRQISQEQYIYSLSDKESWKAKLQTAEFLKHNSQPGETLLVMEGVPGIYILSDKEPVYQEFLRKQQFFENKTIGFAFMQSFETYDGNRRKLMEKLESNAPDLIVLTVDSPTGAFSEIKIFPQFFSFVFTNYNLVKNYDDVWIYKLKDEEMHLSKDLVVDYEFAKRYMLVLPVSKEKVSLEPIGGASNPLDAVLVEGDEADLVVLPLQVNFFKFDGKDFIGHGLEKPSGTEDLHLSLIKEAKEVKMIKIKKDPGLWVYPSNGENSAIKVFDENKNLDLYLEPPARWEDEVFDILIMYNDSTISRQKAEVKK